VRGSGRPARGPGAQPPCAAAGQPRARLFVALEPPVEVRETLAAWAADALSEHPKVRRLRSDHLHVTLCFLGWQPEDAVMEIVQACRAAAAACQSAPRGMLRVSQAIWLPPRQPRVLAVRLVEEGGGEGVEDGVEDERDEEDEPRERRSGRVVRLQSHLSELLERGGWYAPERRPYLPHVTVARVAARNRMRAFDLPTPPPLSFPASRMTVYRSRLTPGGAQYEPLASVELGGG